MPETLVDLLEPLAAEIEAPGVWPNDLHRRFGYRTALCDTPTMLGTLRPIDG